MRHTSEHASDRLIVYQWWLYRVHPIGSENAAGQIRMIEFGGAVMNKS